MIALRRVGKQSRVEELLELDDGGGGPINVVGRLSRLRNDVPCEVLRPTKKMPLRGLSDTLFRAPELSNGKIMGSQMGGVSDSVSLPVYKKYVWLITFQAGNSESTETGACHEQLKLYVITSVSYWIVSFDVIKSADGHGIRTFGCSDRKLYVLFSSSSSRVMRSARPIANGELGSIEKKPCVMLRFATCIRVC